MVLELEKCIKAALLPAAILIVLTVVGYVLLIVGLISSSGLTGRALLLLFGIAAPVVMLTWAGYRGVRTYGMNFAGGVFTGAFTGAIVCIVWVIDLLSSNLLSMRLTSSTLIAGSFVFALMALMFGLVVGTVFGIIGAFIAGRNRDVA